jgi:hypothetical protein
VAVEAKETALFSGSSVRSPKSGKHFLHLDDFSKDELMNMLDLAATAKAKFYARDETFKPFAGQTMAMIFTKPSARTRVSFETVRRPPGPCWGAPLGQAPVPGPTGSRQCAGSPIRWGHRARAHAPANARQPI